VPAADVGGESAVGSSLDSLRYFLPHNYVQRFTPEYFVDDERDGVLWQPDVYPFAAQVALENGCDSIIDLGCGRGGKLVTLHAVRPDWHYIGIDVGSNIAWCQEHLAFGQWIEADLETCCTLQLPLARVRKAIVVCSDVLEHLVNPDVATGLIGSLLRSGAQAAVLSTPARELRAGLNHPGPPRNTAHVREWASQEFCSFVRAQGLEISSFSFSRSDDAGGGRTTQLLLVRSGGQPEGGTDR
jgi:Methyltransferase domain